MSDKKKSSAEIRIKGVPDELASTLRNIHKNLGISQSDMLKPVLDNWAADQPDRLKKPYQE